MCPSVDLTLCMEWENEKRDHFLQNFLSGKCLWLYVMYVYIHVDVVKGGRKEECVRGEEGEEGEEEEEEEEEEEG